MPQPSVTETSFKITYLNFCSNLLWNLNQNEIEQNDFENGAKWLLLCSSHCGWVTHIYYSILCPFSDIGLKKFVVYFYAIYLKNYAQSLHWLLIMLINDSVFLGPQWVNLPHGWGNYICKELLIVVSVIFPEVPPVPCGVMISNNIFDVYHITYATKWIRKGSSPWDLWPDNG